jgi:hypothetical protein
VVLLVLAPVIGKEGEDLLSLIIEMQITIWAIMEDFLSMVVTSIMFGILQVVYR